MKSVVKRRSVAIPTDTLKEIRKAIKSFPTLTEAEEMIGVGRGVPASLLIKKTCAPDTLNAIRKFLANQKTAAYKQHKTKAI